MRFWQFVTRSFIFAGLALALVMSAQMFAQVGSGTLRGQVTDPSGAVITQATVTAASSTGQKKSAITDGRGGYEITGLLPGTYTVTATAKGFSAYQQADVILTAGQAQKLDIPLEIQVEQQQVQVQDQAANVGVDPTENASSVIIKGKDLDALSDDPDELQSDLDALAGPAAGPNGGQIYIDGFSNGTLPPKSSIREIRINQNPFSAQYDRLGFGRVEVFTKPGKDQFHGQFMTNLNNSVFNSRNPFLQVQDGVEIPGYHSEQYSGNFSGPINSKSSFFFNVERRNINETSIVNATVLDSSFNPVPFSQAVLNPRTRTEISPRLDYQVTPNNTLTARYERESSQGTNNGVGQFSLPSQGYNSSSTEHNLQISDTQVLNTSTINETRFNYVRDLSRQTAQSLGSTVSVLDMFTGGGNSVGLTSDHQDHFELQNYTSKLHGLHFVKFGGRLRVNRDANAANSNYNGTFTFTSLTAYQITEQGLAQNQTDAQIRATCLPVTTFNPQTQQQETTMVCGGASQFTITGGTPLARISQVDAGLYAEDDWRVRPSFTVSYGLRFETQSNINDHANFAPRVGFAWGLGKGTSPKTVLRAGIGVFYDRFSQGLVLQAQRANGIVQQKYVVTDPSFYPNKPQDLSTLVNDPTFVPTIYQVSPNLQAPYTIQTAVTLERQLAKTATIAVSYIGSRGLHQLVSENVNAPNADGIRPDPARGNIYQYQSAGIFKQNQLMSNANVRLGQFLSLFGYYSLSYANSNTAGAGSFPSVPGDLAADFGRASFDVRHRGMVGGTISLPHGFRLSPMIMASSGRPFNITLGQDLNGDNIFNDRPAFANAQTLSANLRNTAWGAFDIAPVAGSPIIPINYGVGPGQFTTNLRVSKVFGLGRKLERANAAAATAGGPGPGGPRGGGGGHDHGPGGPGGFGGRGGFGGMGGGSGQRYNLTFSASARNLFNNVNPANPSGNLSSSRFGTSNALAGGGFFSSSANRRIDLQVMFNF